MVITRRDFFSSLDDPAFAEERNTITKAARYYELRLKLLKWAQRRGNEKSNLNNKTRAFLGPTRTGRIGDAYINSHKNAMLNATYKNSAEELAIQRHRDSLASSASGGQTSDSNHSIVSLTAGSGTNIGNIIEKITPRQSHPKKMQQFAVDAFKEPQNQTNNTSVLLENHILETRLTSPPNSSLKEVQNVLKNHGKTLEDLDKSVARILSALTTIQRNMKDMSRGQVSSLGSSGSLNLRRGSIEEIRSNYSSGELSSDTNAHPHMHNLWPTRRTSHQG
eukprot:CAMPEP_0197308148 /NCGR_PEP_ID=MMETSP0891-20130614/6381_1 /TAXON_ID=44058 ORGANISM="Aureoumbra lagunensis, Strain CCMP1510" /NCGR_SAMPLE_ID=MMETSP0891 /ASSEMBLY_ACC=CAM_ASM_000534 /LENGTH=277 /DNA_ID=CAMNT_0042792271 /DNA_START=769 /DNA_END=1602 /DNA_ORIENTATION=+